MKKVLALILLLVVTHFSNSCSSKTESKQESSKPNNSYLRNNSNQYEDEKPETDSYDKTNDEESENEEYSSACKFEDDTYSATVDYSNPETGYYATYTLDVEVEDCQVVQINFPNDGYLDEDHISAAELDEDGTAMVDGEDGKTYQIQIDN